MPKQVVDNRVVDHNYGQPTRQVIGGSVVERKRFTPKKKEKVKAIKKAITKKVNAILGKKPEKKVSKPKPKKVV